MLNSEVEKDNKVTQTFGKKGFLHRIAGHEVTGP